MIPRAGRIEASAAAPNTAGKLALRLWLRLLSCSSMIEQEISRRLRDEFSVTLAQFDVLSELEHAGEPVTMTQLSEQLMVTKGNVTGLIDRLERDGLVRRKPSTDDGRVLFIALTNPGESLFKTMAVEHEQWLLDMFSDLTGDQQGDMIDLLKRTKRSVINYRGLS